MSDLVLTDKFVLKPTSAKRASSSFRHSWLVAVPFTSAVFESSLNAVHRDENAPANAIGRQAGRDAFAKPILMGLIT